MNVSEMITSGIAAELARQGKKKIDLAKPLRLSPNALYSRFRGETDFTTEELAHAADYLGMSFIDLINRCIQQAKKPSAGTEGDED